MEEIKGVTIKEDVSLKDLNTYKVEAKANYLANVTSIRGLKRLITYLNKENIPYFILGAGSNVILDGEFKGVVIKLKGLNKLKIEDDTLVVGAGVMMGVASKASVDNNLTGFEWAINIPGTIGGSINGNAGAYNAEIFDLLESIKVLDKFCKVKTLKKEDIIYGYRHTNIKELGVIVLEATFKLAHGSRLESLELIKNRCERRRQTQPLEYPSAGSVFRNPLNDHAGRLIEQAGLKGKRIGGAIVSEKHANFIVNIDNATSKDIKNLIELVRKEVKDKFQVDLIVEQEIINW